MTAHSRGATRPTDPVTERVNRRPWARPRDGAVGDRVAVGLLVLLAAWVAVRLGLFDLWATVETPAGPVRLTDTYASVDHPFHAARAETLRRALAEGQLLRWVGHHQGGYPVEFYPLGVAWLEVGVWALALGTFSIGAAHKIVVGLVFLLPGLAYALIARRDKLPLGVALAALAAHVAVPGFWYHGGYTELVQWGLVTNVAAAVALLFVLPWLTAFLAHGRGPDVARAALAAAFAVSTNPRSLVALVVVGLGCWLAVAAEPDKERSSLVAVSARLALVAAVAALLAAPELIALLRFADLYDFVQYEGYVGVRDYLRHAVEAVSRPVFALGMGGVVLAWLTPAGTVTRAAAASLPLYVGATLVLTADQTGHPLVRQLEATRLMPFQRLLTIYLAAVALLVLARWLPTAVGFADRPLAAAVPPVAAGLLLVAWAVPAGGAVPDPFTVEAPDRGLYPVAGTATPEQADFLAAVEAADAAAAPGTALLVLGSALSWHQQLWAPLATDRPLFFNDWLWYWQPRHAGPFGYEHRAGHFYPYPDLALSADYFATHGIGAVTVFDDESRVAAAASPLLERVRTGIYDVYVVRRPTTIVTFDGENAATSLVDGQRLAATGTAAGGEILIRRNWYPRWTATVNGRPAPIERTAEGYMRVQAPPGEAKVELVYGVDRLDWLARALSVGGFLGVGSLAAGPWLRRRMIGGRP